MPQRTPAGDATLRGRTFHRCDIARGAGGMLWVGHCGCLVAGIMIDTISIPSSDRLTEAPVHGGTSVATAGVGPVG